ncbi:MAG: DUF1772 domain-containing protein [Pyrinomonadaceae bacterium]
MSELLILLVMFSASLFVGNEFSVGAFINPSFSRLPDVPQAFAARETARLYGRIMPSWMVGNVLLSSLVTFLVADSYSRQWWSYLAATLLFVFVCAFSVLFPVPINNKIADWDPDDLPSDWRELRSRFDRYHWVRIVLLLIAYLSLAFGTVSH